MMLTHETGHVIGAYITGGQVREVVWHPTVISRTDVNPNPNPLIEIWAGPVIGVVLPLIISGALYIPFSNGVGCEWFLYDRKRCIPYLGLGAIWPTGDARQMRVLHVPEWIMILFGSITCTTGFWVWHTISPKLGFGTNPSSVKPRMTYTTMSVALIFTAIAWVVGNVR